MPLSSNATSASHRHWRLTASLLAAALVSSLSGCTLCCAPYDYDFGYNGGAWVRDNPSSGRVGSVFEPAGYKAIDDPVSDSAEGVPTPAGQPATDDSEPMPSYEPMPEATEPPPSRFPPNMTSTPRLRRLQPYLPQN